MLHEAAQAVRAMRAGGARAASLYFGEFGDPLPGNRTWTRAVLAALPAVADVTPLATVWVWEFFQFSATEAANFSLLPGRDAAIIATMNAFNAPQ